MKFTVVIPARFASQRLPGKPLLKIGDKTMIECVYRQALLSDASNVVIATDHADIESEVKKFGGSVCMTRTDHASGTDRLAEVVDALGLAADDIVVNVQGDEPLIPPSVINQVAQNLFENTNASVATVSEPVHDISVYRDPNTVKVVTDVNGMALYFSRAPMPWYRDEQQPGSVNDAVLDEQLSANDNVNSHVGIYAYRASLLREFVGWAPGALEQIEKLEQLRVMENGHKIHVAQATENVPKGIDTPDDLARIRELVK